MTESQAKEQAPWYISAAVTVASLIRELTRSDPECAIRTIGDLEAILRIAQGS